MHFTPVNQMYQLQTSNFITNKTLSLVCVQKSSFETCCDSRMLLKCGNSFVSLTQVS